MELTGQVSVGISLQITVIANNMHISRSLVSSRTKKNKLELLRPNIYNDK